MASSKVIASNPMGKITDLNLNEKGIVMPSGINSLRTNHIKLPSLESPSYLPRFDIDMLGKNGGMDPRNPNIPSWFDKNDPRLKAKEENHRDQEKMQQHFKDQDPTKEDANHNKDNNFAKLKDHHQQEQAKYEGKANKALRESMGDVGDEQHQREMDRYLNGDDHVDNDLNVNEGKIFFGASNDDDKIYVPSKSKSIIKLPAAISQAHGNDNQKSSEANTGGNGAKGSKKRKVGKNGWVKSLSPEVINNIGSHLPTKDILSFATTCKDVREAVFFSHDSVPFWVYLLQRDFPEIIYARNAENQPFIDVIDAGRRGRIRIDERIEFKMSVANNFNNDQLRYAVLYANLFTEKKKDSFLWKNVRNEECYRIVYLMQNLGYEISDVEVANGLDTNYIYAKLYQYLNLFSAIGYFSQVKKIIEKYRVKPTQFTLMKAIRSGNVEVVKYLMSNNEEFLPDLVAEKLLQVAIESDSPRMVWYILQNFKPRITDEIIVEIIKSGNIKILDYVLVSVGKSFSSLITELLDKKAYSENQIREKAIESGKLNMMEELDKILGKEKPSRCYNKLNGYVTAAIRTGSFETLKYVLDKIGKKKTPAVTNEIVCAAVASGRLEMLKLVLNEKKSRGFQPEIPILYAAVKSGNLEVVKYLVKKFGLEELLNGNISSKCVSFSDNPNYVIFNGAIQSGSLEMVKYIVELLQIKSFPVESMIKNFVNEEILEYCTKNRIISAEDKKEGLKYVAVSENNFYMLKYLHPMLTDDLALYIVQHGNLEILKCMIEDLPEDRMSSILFKAVKGCTIEQVLRLLALKKPDDEIMKKLYKEPIFKNNKIAVLKFLMRQEKNLQILKKIPPIVLWLIHMEIKNGKVKDVSNMLETLKNYLGLKKLEDQTISELYLEAIRYRRVDMLLFLMSQDVELQTLKATIEDLCKASSINKERKNLFYKPMSSIINP